MSQSCAYGSPSSPLAISQSQAAMLTAITTRPANADARRSIAAQRSSRPGPPSPRSVSLRPPSRNKAASAAIAAKPCTTSPELPPIANAANTSAPSPSESSGIHHRLLQKGLSRVAICMEYLLYGLVEEARERDRQRQRRCVALLLDRVDGLARDVHRLRELLLGELPVGTEMSDFVAHDVKRTLPAVSSTLSIYAVSREGVPRHHLRVPDERARLRADEGDARVARLPRGARARGRRPHPVQHLLDPREGGRALRRAPARGQGAEAARPGARDRSRRLLGAVGQGAGLPPVPVRRRRVRAGPGP